MTILIVEFVLFISPYLTLLSMARDVLTISYML